jgi:hypothetical protein
MPQDVHDRHEVQTLIVRGAQLVEVLPPAEFKDDHLPGGIKLWQLDHV